MKTRRKRYDYKTLYKERQYGIFWYDWLWRILRPLLIGASVLVLTGGILVTLWNAAGERFWFPVDRRDTSPVTFTVESGSSLTKVASDLEEQGLIRSHAVLRYLMDFRGLSQKVQAGTYTLSRSMTLEEIIERLASGDGRALTTDITIIPGWNVYDVAAYLKDIGIAASREEVYAACNDAETFGGYYFVQEVLATGTAPQRTYLLEGYLAPDTYEIYTASSLETVLRKLLSQFEVVYTSAMHERTAELGMTVDQVITLASMIELEAKTDDFARVSAVFHNRLRLGMNLGSDVTVQYATGSRKMSLGSEELGAQSPYNTYLVPGLPVGPVCNPSKAAIMAALYPDEEFISEQYLYFCSTTPEEGTLVFSKTLEEHEANVRIYRPLWERYDEERGVR